MPGAGVSEAGEKLLGSFDGSEDGEEDGAGDSGSGEMLRWLVFVAVTGGRKTSCGGYPKSTFMYRQVWWDCGVTLYSRVGVK